MTSIEQQIQFKKFLEKYTKTFEITPSPETLTALKTEINTGFKRENIIDCWVMLLKAQGPVEKVSEHKYEIYDVNNFMGESSGSSNDYIHTVELTDEEDCASIFSKFYFVFYCLVNGIRSNEYTITNTGRNKV